ncbi:MAG: hypothetical protein LBQ82_06135 [Treponema sp.]|nr:hypothetical protein [Treponema sp.]
MKKTLCIVAVLLTAVILLASCGGAPKSSGGASAPTAAAAAPAQPAERKAPSNVPQFVKDALLNAPEDALIGIGTAKLASQSQSRTIATTRARAEISRTMNSMIKDMITDYTASSEVDPSAALAYQETITTALSKSTLTGSKVVDFDYTSDGTCWVVVALGKSSLVEEINQSQAAAKLAVPAMAAFNAQDRMESAFNKANGQELQIGDR